jgi:hypothetical protein
MSRLLNQVNSDNSCPDFESKSAFREALPWDCERVTYISTRWNVTRNAARTLILKEVGTHVEEIAAMLYVTKDTVKKYINELCDKIHVNVIMPIEYKTQKGQKFDVWGSGEADPITVTESDKQLDPDYSERDCELNKGIEFHEIDTDLITLK